MLPKLGCNVVDHDVLSSALGPAVLQTGRTIQQEREGNGKETIRNYGKYVLPAWDSTTLM